MTASQECGWPRLLKVVDGHHVVYISSETKGRGRGEKEWQKSKEEESKTTIKQDDEEV